MLRARGPRYAAPARTWSPPRCPGRWARRSGTARRCRPVAPAGRGPTGSTCTADRVAPARSRSETDDAGAASENRREVSDRPPRVGTVTSQNRSAPPQFAARLTGRTVLAVVVHAGRLGLGLRGDP